MCTICTVCSKKWAKRFFQNAALWLASPYAVQIGALGMVAIGAVYGLLPADKLEAESRRQKIKAARSVKTQGATAQCNPDP